MTEWPFQDPQNVAVFTTKYVVYKEHPILLVTHDLDDGSWQFLDSLSSNDSDAMVVALKNIVELDSTIMELADLPLGWRAERSALNQEWVRFENNK